MPERVTESDDYRLGKALRAVHPIATFMPVQTTCRSQNDIAPFSLEDYPCIIGLLSIPFPTVQGGISCRAFSSEVAWRFA